jgi:hypothetical protein
MSNYTQQFNELNDVSVPFQETDVYKFLEDNWIDNRFEAKLAYLVNRFNFNKDEDTIGKNCLDIFNLIHSQYFYLNIRQKG